MFLSGIAGEVISTFSGGFFMEVLMVGYAEEPVEIRCLCSSDLPSRYDRVSVEGELHISPWVGADGIIHLSITMDVTSWYRTGAVSKTRVALQ